MKILVCLSFLLLLCGSALGCSSVFLDEDYPNYEDFDPNPTQNNVLPPRDSFPVEDTIRIIHDQLGPFTAEGVNSLHGGATLAEQLDCDFSDLCCWYNVAAGHDDLEWAVVSERPDPAKAASFFKVQKLPEANFAATAVGQTHSLTYGFLTSCPITCMKEPGVLIFDHWVSDGVAFDICTLPLNSRNFTYCTTVREREPVEQLVSIPVHREPFMIVIVASEFTVFPGGLAAVDNIKYSGELCKATDLDKQKPNKGTQIHDIVVDSDFEYFEACKGLYCDWSGVSPLFGGKMCNYVPLQKGDPRADLAVPFSPKEKMRTGNYAAGVFELPPNSEHYVGGIVYPKEIVAMKSSPVFLNQDFDVEFWFWEQAAGVNLQVCLDSLQNCKQVSPSDVAVAHRRWRKASVRIPKSKGGNTRRIIIVSENTGHQIAAVGIGPINIIANKSLRILCDAQKVEKISGNSKADISLKFA